MGLHLGVDVGTQGTKALVYDPEVGAVVGRGARSYGLIEGLAPGACEQDPATWVEAVRESVREALVGLDASAVAGVGVSGQQHGFVALDEALEVIRPAKLWCDTETAPEAEELSQLTGVPTPAGFTASKILWLKRHEPASFARLAHVLLPHDYINLVLTGELAMECGDASGTGFFDPVERAFSSARMSAIDDSLEGWLPELIGPDVAVGGLREEWAEAWGVPSGIPVSPGSGDNMMSAIGSGAVRPGVMVMSLGTSGTLFAQAEAPVIDPAGEIAPFCDATGHWMPLLCTLNCTTATEEVRAGTGLDHRALTEAAREIPPGCGGVSFLPFLAGERTPDWPHATGALLGLREGSLRPGLLFRAAMEGATFALAAGAERLKKLGVAADELMLVGGGSKNSLWREIVADVTGLRVRLPKEAESAALGGALQSLALAAKEPLIEALRSVPVPLEEEAIEPSDAARGTYDEALARHTERAAQLFG